MFDKKVVAYIRATMEDEKSVEKQVEFIEEYCDENNIIAFGFYEEIGEEITQGMIDYLKESCTQKSAKILVASLSIIGPDIKKVAAVIKDFKASGIEVLSLNQWDMQVLSMCE